MRVQIQDVKVLGDSVHITVGRGQISRTITISNKADLTDKRLRELIRKEVDRYQDFIGRANEIKRLKGKKIEV